MNQPAKAWRCVALACVALLGAAASAHAYDYGKKIKVACANDYAEYCSQYEPESTQLRRCFESNRRGLSHYCITALIAAGEVPARYMLKR